jgi:hypothetical protein
LRYTFNPADDLYHGTLDIYADLIIKHGIKIITRSKGGVDFGPGFYLTFGNEEQARNWADKKAELPAIPNRQVLDLLQMTVRDFLGIRDSIKPSIVKFRIKDPDAWMSLRRKIFTRDDIEWKRYVWTWRQATEPPEQYDWIFGPVADGGINQASFQKILAYNDHNQLSVHNEKAAQLLEVREVISWQIRG